MKVLRVVALLVVLTGCTSGVDTLGDGSEESPSSYARGDLDSEYEFEPYPGSRWYGPDGDEIPDESFVINAITGPDHCGWESGVMMHVGWPLGHAASDASESRQYFRDPQGVFPDYAFLAKFDASVTLPEKAEYTGYRTDFMELWLVSGDGRAAYLVFADHVERWPRSSDTIACA